MFTRSSPERERETVLGRRRARLFPVSVSEMQVHDVPLLLLLLPLLPLLLLPAANSASVGARLHAAASQTRHPRLRGTETAQLTVWRRWSTWTERTYNRATPLALDSNSYSPLVCLRTVHKIIIIIITSSEFNNTDTVLVLRISLLFSLPRYLKHNSYSTKRKINQKKISSRRKLAVSLVVQRAFYARASTLDWKKFFSLFNVVFCFCVSWSRVRQSATEWEFIKILIFKQIFIIILVTVIAKL